VLAGKAPVVVPLLAEFFAGAAAGWRATPPCSVTPAAT